MSAPGAIIFGCAELRLTGRERDFFRDADPLGFILFARNCEHPQQVRALVADLRDTVGRADAPVLIDQEGGRVQRFGPPHCRAAPAAAVFGQLYERDPEMSQEAARLNSYLIGCELAALGIDVDCLPVLDVPVAGADQVIGDRAYADNPMIVATLGRAAAEGLIDAGVMPVIKHIPGHGRATADSHKVLPRVRTDRATLTATDFLPFRRAADLPWAMTAHVLYSDLDADRPATLSSFVIEEIVRGDIGFDGLLISDDIGMGALGGSFAERTAGALAAGCDVVLHCSAEPAEMAQVADAARPMNASGMARFRRGQAKLSGRKEVDVAEAATRLNRMLTGR